MGATSFIATHGSDNSWAKENRRTLDLIIATTNDAKMPLLDYASLLKPGGHLVCMLSFLLLLLLHTDMLFQQSSAPLRSLSLSSPPSLSSWATST
jgi:D-arabinose 1-dehydrogenase-like Zn-dependent alcohol dehydrogenase